MTQAVSSIIALDVGERRIGVAIARLPARLPNPWGAIERSAEAATKLKQLAADEATIAIVVGLPRNLSGQETSQTKAVRQFVSELEKVIALPFHFQDEALTSVQAEQELGQRQIGYNKGAVDALAATYILSDWLTEHQEIADGDL